MNPEVPDMPLVAAPGWLASFFVVLLLFLVAGPVLFKAFWERSFRIVCIVAGVYVFAYYSYVLESFPLALETFAAYVSFILLLTLLYLSSRGVFIFVDAASKPLNNIIFFITGAVLANVFGTVAASILLLPPFMQVNRSRLKAYHIVFFIFIISNTGGLLSPFGNLPFLAAYFMDIGHKPPMIPLIFCWLLALIFLLSVFFVIDTRNNEPEQVQKAPHSNRVGISGKRNLLWLAFAMLTLFIHPLVFDGLPYIEAGSKKIYYLREIIQLVACVLCHRFTDKQVLKKTDFLLEPLFKAVFIFFGIFLTLLPATQFIYDFVRNSPGVMDVNPGTVYWVTALLSGFFNNVPAYISGLSLINAANVPNAFVPEAFLLAVAAGAVLAGALTFGGNFTNYLIRGMAEKAGVDMPAYGRYILKYSLPFLLPLLLIIWLLFFI